MTLLAAAAYADARAAHISAQLLYDAAVVDAARAAAGILGAAAAAHAAAQEAVAEVDL